MIRPAKPGDVLILIGSVAKPATAYINGIGPQSTFAEELEKEDRKLDTYLIPLLEAGERLKTVGFGEISFDSWHKFF